MRGVPLVKAVINLSTRQHVLQSTHSHSLMELSLSWEAVNCVATQELLSVLCNPTVHYSVHKSPPVVLSWARPIQPIPSHPISLRYILIFSTHQRLGLSRGLLPSGFTTNILYAFLFSPIRATCPAHRPPWLDHSNYTWRRVQVMKLLIL
jgi:hypothetical protein